MNISKRELNHNTAGAIHVASEQGYVGITDRTLGTVAIMYGIPETVDASIQSLIARTLHRSEAEILAEAIAGKSGIDSGQGHASVSKGKLAHHIGKVIDDDIASTGLTFVADGGRPTAVIIGLTHEVDASIQSRIARTLAANADAIIQAITD